MSHEPNSIVGDAGAQDRAKDLATWARRLIEIAEEDLTGKKPGPPAPSTADLRAQAQALLEDDDDKPETNGGNGAAGGIPPTEPGAPRDRT